MYIYLYEIYFVHWTAHTERRQPTNRVRHPSELSGCNAVLPPFMGAQGKRQRCKLHKSSIEIPSMVYADSIYERHLDDKNTKDLVIYI